MLPDPRRFLERLAQREQSAWARRARCLNEGQCTLTTHYSVYAVSEGALTRMHARVPGAPRELENARWLLIGYLTTQGEGAGSRYALVDRGRRGDKAVFWEAGASHADLEAARFLITSRLVEDPRRVLVRPRSTPATPIESTLLMAMPPSPRVPAEFASGAPTPTGGVLARAPIGAALPPTAPPPRRTSYPPRALVVPLRAAPKAARLPLPSLVG